MKGWPLILAGIVMLGLGVEALRLEPGRGRTELDVAVTCWVGGIALIVVGIWLLVAS